MPRKVQRSGNAFAGVLQGSVQVVVNDLLREALNAAQLHGTVRPAPARTKQVARIMARVHAAGKAPRLTRGKSRAPRTAHDDKRVLHQVREVHEAAAHGYKVQAVMRHFGWEDSKAGKLIHRSQIVLQWGKAHERSKGSRKSTRKDNKT